MKRFLLGAIALLYSIVGISQPPNPPDPDGQLKVWRLAKNLASSYCPNTQAIPFTVKPTVALSGGNFYAGGVAQIDWVLSGGGCSGTLSGSVYVTIPSGSTAATITAYLPAGTLGPCTGTGSLDIELVAVTNGNTVSGTNHHVNDDTSIKRASACN